jgi:hypothetical protein
MRRASYKVSQALVALAAGLATYAHAGTIEVSPFAGGESGIVTLTGRFDLIDSQTFRTKTASLSKAIIVFSSDGGNLDAGIKIGEAARLKGFVTMVPAGARCASACALAWLGGTRRLMGTGAHIGFHSAADVSTGALSGTGDALIGAYLNKIGLPERAILYITEKAPSDIQWLTISDAAQIGLDVQAYQSPAKKAGPLSASKEAAPESPQASEPDQPQGCSVH